MIVWVLGSLGGWVERNYLAEDQWSDPSSRQRNGPAIGLSAALRNGKTQQKTAERHGQILCGLAFDAGNLG